MPGQHRTACGSRQRHSDLRGRRRPAGQCALKRWRPAARLVRVAGLFAEALQRGFIELAELLHRLVRALHFVSHAVAAKVSSIKLHIKVIFRNNACRTCVAGILLPHNESRLRVVTYP
jgi:hypothetical protein